jgi:hypothetical protein
MQNRRQPAARETTGNESRAAIRSASCDRGRLDAGNMAGQIRLASPAATTARMRKCGVPIDHDGWAAATPAEVGLDAATLSELDAFLRQWPKRNVHAVVIARRGKLVFER